MFKGKFCSFVLFGAFLIFFGVQADNGVICELAAFLENPDATNPVLIDSGRSNETFSTCDEEQQKRCVQLVERQVIEGTKGGNFTFPLDKEEYTIGDVLCDKADAVEENVRNKMVQIYWRLCDSKWKKTTFKMPEPLCCDDGLYIPCRMLKQS